MDNQLDNFHPDEYEDLSRLNYINNELTYNRVEELLKHLPAGKTYRIELTFIRYNPNTHKSTVVKKMEPVKQSYRNTKRVLLITRNTNPNVLVSVDARFYNDSYPVSCTV
jgi:hypothetical protein